MMNVATPPSAPLPNHFAPPAGGNTGRRRMHHHPTLHMRTGSGSSQQFNTQDFVTVQSSQIPPPPYSPSISSGNLRRSPSSQPGTPPAQRDTYGQQNRAPQRYPIADSSNSLNTYGSLAPMGNRRQPTSTSTSTSSINRIPSGYGHQPLTPPIIQVRPGSVSPADTYVSRLRRAKATVWSARGQAEDLNRSNSKDDKYNKKPGKRVVSTKNKLVSGGTTYESTLPAHPRQLAPRLSANEAEESDYIDPFISGPNFFDTTNTAASIKASIKTKTTTSSTAPSTNVQNTPFTNNQGSDNALSRQESKSSKSIEDGRGSPDPIQSYYTPPGRGQSKRVSRVNDDGVKDHQVGGERRLFVVNPSPEESEDEE